MKIEYCEARENLVDKERIQKRFRKLINRFLFVCCNINLRVSYTTHNNENKVNINKNS